MKNDFSELIKAAYTEPAVGDDFKHRVMLEVARRAIMHSRRRARRGLIASVSALAILLAACIVLLLTWFPTHIILFPKLHLPWFEDFMCRLAEMEPFFGQWGVLLALTLLVSGVVGFAYYLNCLFSENQ